MVLGCPKGKKSAPEKYKLHDKRILIQELLKAEVSQRKIAKICKVDRNTLARIFGRFEKLDNFAQGTGLGLSIICKAIADETDGEIGFESQVNVGSEFWYRIY